MVSFAFTPEQQAFAKTLAEYSRKVLLPGYRERAASTEFPFGVLRQLGELGVLGIGLPERYGGTGVDDPVLLGLVAETIAYGDVNMASSPIQVGLIASQLAQATEEVQERYLPPLIEGRETLAIALTEPGSGSDAAGLAAVAGGREDRDLLGLQRGRGAGVRARPRYHAVRGGELLPGAA
jgi:cyclohexanecarboxyl-CoA dehydrogenase